MEVTQNIDLADLASADPRVRYGCSKKVLALAKEDPAALYPQRDFFVKLLESDNRIMRWTAISVLGALARVDRSADIGDWVTRLIGFLNTGNMITANNAIAALAGVAAVRPEYRPMITTALINVENNQYDTTECRNIAVGKAIQALEGYFDGLEDKDTALAFVGRHTGNRRNATRKKAERFLRKYGRPG